VFWNLQKEKEKSLRFSAIITGASQGGSTELWNLHHSAEQLFASAHKSQKQANHIGT